MQTLALKDVEANAAAAKDDAALSAAGGAEPAVTKQVEAQDALLETPAVLLTAPEDDKTPALKRPAASSESVKPHAPIKKKPAAAQKVVAKAGSKSVAPKKGAKPKTIVNCKKGWVMEIRQRDSGQKDKHYKSPDGTMYRIRSDAVKNGFPGQ